MIDGNKEAIVQMKVTTGKNVIGEAVESWSDIGTVIGWLDYSTGQNEVQQYQAKLQDTTHYFMCDFFRWQENTQGLRLTPENCRFLIDDVVYDVLLIDNPMGLNQHLEIYLKYIGGGLGV